MPRELDRLTFEEFNACLDGYREANDPNYRRSMTDQEFEQISAAYDAAPETMT